MHILEIAQSFRAQINRLLRSYMEEATLVKARSCLVLAEYVETKLDAMAMDETFAWAGDEK